MSRPINQKQIVIKKTEDIANLFMEELKYEKIEHLKVVLLNKKNVVLKIVEVARGGTNSASVEPKEIMLEAIKISASKIILVHNHPSGDPTPSKADYNFTDRIYEAADILGLQLLDHVVIGNRQIQKRNVFTKVGGTEILQKNIL